MARIDQMCLDPTNASRLAMNTAVVATKSEANVNKSIRCT